MNSVVVRRPLQALLIAQGNMVAEVISGQKRISIREGHRDYHAGKPVMLCCHIANWCLMADIVSVRHCTLEDVTDEEMRADGFDTRGVCLSCLQVYYPDITWESPVTVITWDNVRGGMLG